MAAIRKIFTLFAVFSFGFFASVADIYADTHMAASASYADVSAAVSAASSGDIVEVPAGSATWSSTLAITKGLILQGAGIGNTVITSNIDNTSGHLIAYDPASPALDEPFRLTGFTFDGAWKSGGVSINNSAHDLITKVRVDHNRFHECKTRAVVFWGHCYGLVDHNIFEDNAADTHVFGWNWYSWEELPVSLGSANYVYVEDNTFTYTGARASFTMSAGQGGKMVFRHNTINNHFEWDILDAHGNLEPVTAAYRPGGSRSTMGVEIYENTFTSAKTGRHRLFYQRGGKAIVFNNILTGDNVTGVHIYMTEEDDWRLDFVDSPPAYDTVNESFFFANTYNDIPVGVVLLDAEDSEYIVENSQYWLPSSGLDANKPGTCTLNSYYGATDTGKIYKCEPENTWTLYYTPYEYPHPLSRPSAPVNLQIVTP